MSDETDIEKLARECLDIQIVALRLRMVGDESIRAGDIRSLAQFAIAEHQRADALAKRERELRELLSEYREGHRRFTCWSPTGEEGDECHACNRADALLAKEPQ